MSKLKIALVAVALVVVGIIVGGIYAPKESNLGGLVNINPTQFVNGFSAGTTNQFSVSSAGALTTSGAITNTGAVTNTSTLTVGSSGSAVSTLIFGQFGPSSCTGTATQAIGAKTTYTCTVSGALTNDRVFVTLASTTPDWVLLTTAYASTTGSNDIRVVLFNASSTGAAASATTTGAKYLIVR